MIAKSVTPLACKMFFNRSTGSSTE
jgi:hypothetical protein